MKKILFLVLLSMSTVNFSFRRSTDVVEGLDKISKEESVRQDRLEKRKDKLEKELSDLRANYDSRVDMVEKLKLDSEVRWYRDEYKEILKKYDVVQDDLQKEIDKREKELNIVNIGLGIREEVELED